MLVCVEVYLPNSFWGSTPQKVNIEPENVDFPFLRFRRYSEVPAVNLPGSTAVCVQVACVSKLATRFNAYHGHKSVFSGNGHSSVLRHIISYQHLQVGVLQGVNSSCLRVEGRHHDLKVLVRTYEILCIYPGSCCHLFFRNVETPFGWW